MLSRISLILVLLAALAAVASSTSSGSGEPIKWRNSRSVGVPWDGRLVRGVQLPPDGEHFFTWDPVLKRSPDRWWRRWGNDRLLRMVLGVIDDYAAAHPEASRVGIGDLSRPNGGVFDERFGGLGHASHQNGLDADVLYPRKDGLERRAYKPSQVDEQLSQDLLDRFIAAGAYRIFVGPRLHLHGPRKIVIPLAHHDDHMHVRIHNAVQGAGTAKTTR